MRRLLVPVLMMTVASLLPAQARDTSACPGAGAGTEVRLEPDSTPAVPARTDSVSRAATQAGDRADIILRASVSAREVRFNAQPRVTIRLCGGTLDSVRILERRNLPSPVVAGTTYRDVYVAIEILGHVRATCLAHALIGGGAAPAWTNELCASVGARDSVGAAPARRPPP